MAPKRPNDSGDMSDSRGDAVVRQRGGGGEMEVRGDKVDCAKKKEKKKASIGATAADPPG